MKKFLSVSDIVKDLYPSNAIIRMELNKKTGQLKMKSSINKPISKKTAYRRLNEMKHLYPHEIKYEILKKNGQYVGKKSKVSYKGYHDYVLNYYDRENVRRKLVHQIEMASKRKDSRRLKYSDIVDKYLNLEYRLHAIKMLILRGRHKCDNLYKEVLNTGNTSHKIIKDIKDLNNELHAELNTNNIMMLHSIYSTRKEGLSKLCTHSRMINKRIIKNMTSSKGINNGIIII